MMNFFTCPECKSNLIEDANKGERFCSRCGYVVVEQIPSFAPESISTDLEDLMRNSRNGSPVSYAIHDLGLSTEIANTYKDFNGNTIGSAMIEQMNNVRRWHSRIRVASSKERRLSNVLSKINEICSILNSPKIVAETASMIYRNYENNSVAKGKTVICMAIAAVYIACKQLGIVRSLKEIVSAINMQDSDAILRRASKYYRNIMMSYKESNVLGKENISLSIDRYIAKLVNISGLDTKVEKVAIDLAHKTEDHLLADGKAPSGLAAAYIYIASILLDVNIQQKDVSGFSNITEVTIRNRCKDILTAYKVKIILKPKQ